MEDLLEEIVGEIEDESDEVAKPVERLRDGSYLVDASLSIRDLSEDYRIPIPEGEDYETLAGFVLSQLQTIPRGGEFFFSKNMKVTVVEVDRQRVSRVRIEFLDAPASPGTSDISGKPSAESTAKPSGGHLP
jgi:putative hemolysin